MADEKIIDLTPIVTQNTTDLYETSANGTGSFKETRAQQVSYMGNHIAVNSPTMSYVSTGGNDTNSGSIISPFLTVQHALTSASANTQINVTPGTFVLTGSQNFTANTYLNGTDPISTTFTMSGNLGIDLTSWTAASLPKMEIKNIGLNCGTINLTTTAFKANSICNIYNTDFTLGSATVTTANIPNLSIVNSKCPILSMQDHSTVLVRGCTVLTGDLTFTILTPSNYPSAVVYIDDVDMNGNNISIQNFGGSASDILVFFRNVRNVNSIIYDDGGAGFDSKFNLDLASFGSGSITDNSFGHLTLVVADNLVNADTSKGIGLLDLAGTNYFKWYGNQGSGASYNLLAGQLAHLVGAINNCTLLGLNSTSSKNGCFVWSDGLSLSPNHFPAADNQAMFYAAGGFGIGAPNNTIQAGFHYGHAYGNDGNFLFSAVAAVTSANMAASEVNPYVTNNNITFQYKTSGGTTQNAYIVTPVTITSSTSLVAGCEYISNGATNLSITLPTTAAVGDKYKVSGQGAGLYTIQQNAGQSIVFGQFTTTTGVAGNIGALQRYQDIEIECITANTGFKVTYASGANWSINSGGNFNNILNTQVLPVNNPTSTGIFNASGTFLTNSNPVFAQSPASYNTTSGSTIAAIDWLVGPIVVNPSANQSINSPTASDVATAYTTPFGTPVAGQAFRLKYFNLSAFTSTITAGTGVTFARGNTTTVIPSQGDVDFICVWTSSSAFTVYGN